MNSSRSGRILIFIVTYNARDHIIDVLNRIPRKLSTSYAFDILIIDDCSTDDTIDVISDFVKVGSLSFNIIVQKNRKNLGYGGNQKIGYQYALDHAYTSVVLLHGDGQYAPEYLPAMLHPILDDTADVVLGSRMLRKIDALRGKMPLYKWLGNIVLTSVQNILLGTRLSEFHTGYRAFATEVLRNIPLHQNSDYYDFDTEILIQIIDRYYRIKEIAIPTFYGSEISYVNGLKYAVLILYATLKSRFVKKGWAKDRRFECNRKVKP